MLNDEICKLRDKLNKSIEEGKDYHIIYKLSVELDELIASYYNKNNKKKPVIALILKNNSLQYCVVGNIFVLFGTIWHVPKRTKFLSNYLKKIAK